MKSWGKHWRTGSRGPGSAQAGGWIVAAGWVALLPALAGSAAWGATVTQQNGTNLTVSCGTTESSTIVISQVGTVTDVNVINVTHENPEMGEVTITLTDPSGTVTVVIKESGDGGVGDAMTNIDFDDSAASDFPSFQTNGSCNSNTTYRPHGDLSDFNGLQINGSWTLAVSESDCTDASDCDCDAFSVGPACPRVFDNWGLEITFDAAPPCNMVSVDNEMISTMQTRQACEVLTVGPAVTISTAMGAGLYAGQSVELGNGVTFSTGAQVSVGDCGQSWCSVGSAMDSTCAPCVEAICTVDPYCCTFAWDGICIGRVASTCGLLCS